MASASAGTMEARGPRGSGLLFLENSPRATDPHFARVMGEPP